MKHKDNEIQLVPRDKFQYEPGKRYKGSFWVNEYGQAFFNPYKKSDKENTNGYRLVSDSEHISLCESGRKWRIAITIPKEGLTIPKALAFFTAASSELLNYLVKK